MRFISLIALVGCGGGWAELSIDRPTPLGVGLTASYKVDQTYCDPAPDRDCGNLLAPDALAVAVTSGPVLLGRVDKSAATFELTGQGAGTAILELTGNDDITTTVSLDVVPATTTLVVERHVDDAIALPDVTSPAHALTFSVIQVVQRNVAPDGSAVAGVAVVAFDHGTSRASVGDDGIVSTGDVAGTAHMTAMSPNDASLDLDIVGVDAIADFSFAYLGDTITMSLAQGGFDMVLAPTDAAGEPIAGTGNAPPQVSVADTSVAATTAANNQVAPAFLLDPVATGSTTLDVTWASVHKTFPITVTP